VWAKISWESPTLGLWFTGMMGRFEQLDGWVYKGRPKSFWLTGWFNPQGFLTSMQQEVARKHQGWALDDVQIAADVLKLDGLDDPGLKEGPNEGVYIHGLFLEGCAWSKKENKLVDSAPKQLFAALPIMFVTAVLSAETKGGKNNYSCPVYKNKKRGLLNFIVALPIRSEEAPMRWVLRGVALLSSKD